MSNYKSRDLTTSTVCGSAHFMTLRDTDIVPQNLPLCSLPALLLEKGRLEGLIWM